MVREIGGQVCFVLIVDQSMWFGVIVCLFIFIVVLILVVIVFVLFCDWLGDLFLFGLFGILVMIGVGFLFIVVIGFIQIVLRSIVDELVRFFVDMMGQGFVVIDVKGGIVYVNCVYVEMIGVVFVFDVCTVEGLLLDSFEVLFIVYWWCVCF